MPIVSFGTGYPVDSIKHKLDWARWKKEHVMYFKEANEPLWLDRDRIVWPVSGLIDSHLRNIERWLLGRGSEDIPGRKRAYEVGWYNIIRDELDRRGLEPLADHDSINPQSVDFDMPTIEEPRERIKVATDHSQGAARQSPSIAQFMRGVR